MRKLVITALLTLCALPLYAQGYEPLRAALPPLSGGATAPLYNNAITAQIDEFKWDLRNVGGISGRSNFLFAADLSSQLKSSGSTATAKGGSIVYGGWYSHDTEHISAPVTSFNIAANWWNLYGGYMQATQSGGAFGATVGYLNASVDHGLGTASWYDVSLAGSITPKKADNVDGPFTLGATVGYADGSSNNPGNGLIYTLQAAYAITPAFTLNAAYWDLDVQKSGSVNISRFSGGIGYRF